jgi:hypothetical protein
MTRSSVRIFEGADHVPARMESEQALGVFDDAKFRGDVNYSHHAAR